MKAETREPLEAAINHFEQAISEQVVRRHFEQEIWGQGAERRDGARQELLNGIKTLRGEIDRLSKQVRELEAERDRLLADLDKAEGGK